MSSLYSDNVFDMLTDEIGDIDVTKLVSKAEALAEIKQEQQKLEKQLAHNGYKVSDHKNFVVVYSDETDEQKEQKMVDYFDDSKEIDEKIVAQEKVELTKKNDEHEKDLEGKRRDINNNKKEENRKLNFKEKEEAVISPETEKRDADNKRPVEKKKRNKKEEKEVEGSTGVVRGFFINLHKAVIVVAFMAFGAVMYSTWKEL